MIKASLTPKLSNSRFNSQYIRRFHEHNIMPVIIQSREREKKNLVCDSNISKMRLYGSLPIQNGTKRKVRKPREIYDEHRD